MSKIFVALDTTNIHTVQDSIQQFKPYIAGIKLGLEFFCGNGPYGIQVVRDTIPVFLDLKLHDIPNTVAKAIKATEPLAPKFITIHTSGGIAMMKAAVEAANSITPRPQLIGVTVLTSLSNSDLTSIGQPSVISQVERLALLAQDCGLDGIVCSPMEIAKLRQMLDPNMIIITPGIRPIGSDMDDQSRTMTPGEAINAGADYLVIGRPITQSPDPIQVLKSLIVS